MKEHGMLEKVQLVFEGSVRNETTGAGKALWRKRLMFASQKFLLYYKEQTFSFS